MKAVLIITLMALLLSACGVQRVSRVVSRPSVDVLPGEAGGPPLNTPNTPEVKVVEMVTQTSTPVTGADLPSPTRTPVLLHGSLSDMGLPVATYTDTVSGLAFDYPAGWKLTDVPDEDKKNAVIYSITLRSMEATSASKQQDGIPPGMTAIDVTVFKQGAKTLEQAINERRASATTTESGQPVIIALEDEWVLPDGLQAHYFLFNLGPDNASAGGGTGDRMSSELVTIINGKMVLVSGLGDQSLFNVIAASLRGIK